MAELVSMAKNKQLESQFNPPFLVQHPGEHPVHCAAEPATAERMVFSLSNLLRYSLTAARQR